MVGPRDVESEVADLADVYLYTIDDLKEVVAENLQSRQVAAAEAEQIIDMQVVNFMQWVKSLDAVPAIVELRDSADQLRDNEMLKAQRMLDNGEDPATVMQQLARSLTNKLTHSPTTVLKQANLDGNLDLLAAARKLFGLKEK